jgi:hypothetical protein
MYDVSAETTTICGKETVVLHHSKEFCNNAESFNVLYKRTALRTFLGV